MRILIVSTSYSPSVNGQAIFTVNLAEGLERRGHTLAVIQQSETGQAYHATINAIEVFAAPSISLSVFYPGLVISLYPRKTIERVFQAFQPDIVHLQDHYPLGAQAFRLARKHGVPVIGTNHFMPENLAPYLKAVAWLGKGVSWILWQWVLGLYNQLDAVTTPSKTAASIMRRQGLGGQVFPISCGVDPKIFHPMPDIDRGQLRAHFGLHPTHKLLVFVGRVDAEKRVDVLLHALHKLGRRDVQLAVAGKGAAATSLQRLAGALGLGEQVHFLGYVPEKDLPFLLNSADLFTMPSEAELLSIATLEAMACGLPVLAARARALPELVDDGVNGALFLPGDPADAARRLAELLDNRSALPEMQAASLEKVAPHWLENTLNRYEEIYREVIAGRVRSADWGFPHLRRTIRSRAQRKRNQRKASSTID